MYRVRHISSGLFYRPCRQAGVSYDKYRYHVKSNLAKTPKIYHTKPSIGMLSGTFYNHLEAQKLVDQWAAKSNVSHFYNCPHKLNELRPFLSSEWMVETMVDGEWKEFGNLA